MKKILAILLVLVLVPISGLGSAKSEIEGIFYEIPVSVFSRYPADNFIVPLMLINKGDKEIKVRNITFALSDGTKILEKDLEETLNPSLLKDLGNNEIRDKIGIVLPEEKSAIKAKEFLDKAKTMEKGEERTGNIEAAWLLLMNKDHYTETEETEKILSHSKIFYFTIHLKDLYKDIEPVDFIPININMVISNLDGSTYTISQTTTLFYLNSLPSQWGWYPGDGHMHTEWSDGDSPILSVANHANNKNLKWIIITDHAGDSQHTSQPRLEWNEWSGYKTDCYNAQNTYPITVCPGEELATVEGTGGDFSFYQLGQPIFLEQDILNEEIGIEKIQEYVWYTETKESFVPQEESYFLGKKEDTAYYFYYQKDSITTLDEKFLRTLKTKAKGYIIYADNCLLTKELMQKYNIIFKKIPRDITRF